MREGAKEEKRVWKRDRGRTRFRYFVLVTPQPASELFEMSFGAWTRVAERTKEGGNQLLPTPHKMEHLWESYLSMPRTPGGRYCQRYSQGGRMRHAVSSVATCFSTAVIVRGRRAVVAVKANSHRHARHDKTVLSVSRPLWWCELDSRQPKTVADKKNLKSDHAQSNSSS